MKTNIGVVIVAGALGVTGLGAQTIVERQHSQQHRIQQGARSGQLTRLEAARLQSRAADLARGIHRDRIDGGGLTPAERLRIDKRQDALSRDIFRESHDRQRR